MKTILFLNGFKDRNRHARVIQLISFMVLWTGILALLTHLIPFIAILAVLFVSCLATSLVFLLLSIYPVWAANTGEKLEKSILLFPVAVSIYIAENVETLKRHKDHPARFLRGSLIFLHVSHMVAQVLVLILGIGLFFEAATDFGPTGSMFHGTFAYEWLQENWFPFWVSVREGIFSWI